MQPYAVTTEKPNKLFTDKEWEVLFFTMHRLNSKQIARKLGIFPSTVEFYLKAIYGKANVLSTFELRAFCKSEGVERYIPSEFINKGRGFVEMGGYCG